MQQKFWNDTGPESDDGGTSRTLLPTPDKSCGERGGTTRRGKRPSGSDRQVSINDACKSILSVADSPASLFRWRDDAREWLTSDGSGLPFAKWYESSDRDGYWLKTYQDSCQLMLDGSLEEFSATWPSSGTMRAGKCYQQPPLVRRISAKESSLLPTPSRSHCDQRPPATLNLLPTPTKSDHKRSGPTIIRKDGKDRTNDRLDYAVEQSGPIGGLLNPQFVEAMMGLPIGWTDLNASEMQ